MVINMEQFNKETKVIDKQLVSLLESWENNGKKYQVKFGDIFRTVDTKGVIEYYLYYDLGKAYHVTNAIKAYIETENVDSIENFDFLFDHMTDYWFYEQDEVYFTSTLDEEGLVVEQGIEGLDRVEKNIASIQLVYINDEDNKDDFLEEWKNKVIVADYDVKRTYGKLGDKTSVEGVFVGDVYELYDVEADERDTYILLEVEKGKHEFWSHRRYDLELESVFEQAKIEIEEALADGLTDDEIALFVPKKHKSYKNLTDIDVFWAGEFLELIEAI